MAQDTNKRDASMRSGYRGKFEVLGDVELSPDEDAEAQMQIEQADSEQSEISPWVIRGVTLATRRRIKVTAVLKDRRIPDIVEEACIQWLERNSGGY